MARDIFSIPASGAGVERLFNKGRDINNYRRGRLNAKTIEMLMMLHMHTGNNQSFHVMNTETGSIKSNDNDSEDDINDATVFSRSRFAFSATNV